MANNRILEEVCLPDSSDLERLILADIISMPEVTRDVERLLSPTVFSDKQCEVAWEILTKMFNAGEQINLTTANVKLDESLVKSVIPYLDKTGGPLSASQHCQELLHVHLRRKITLSAHEMLRKAGDKTIATETLLSTLDEFAAEIRRDLKSDVGCVKYRDAINVLAGALEKAQKDKQKGITSKVPTSIPSLDVLTYSGFDPGNLVILAARPGVGKTALMLQMARTAALGKKAALVFSLEMTIPELCQRLLFSTGDITPRQLACAEIEWTAFEKAAGCCSHIPLFLNDSVKTIDEIANSIILCHQQGKCDIAFIDYLGLIDMGRSKIPRYQAIADVTRRLKQLAKDCEIPVVLLCQLNRASASENRPPALYDLRDSGAIEQDADIVLMLERDTHINRVNVWLRKNRHGKAHDVIIVLEPDATYTNFTEVEVRH